MPNLAYSSVIYNYKSCGAARTTRNNKLVPMRPWGMQAGVVKNRQIIA